jgi:hypothetical protein
MIINQTNNLHIGVSKTRLSYGESAGTSIIRWENPAGFSPSWAIQLGEIGEEQSEVVILGTSAVAGGTSGSLTGTTLYEHPTDTPIYAIKYNQVVFEVSTTGTAGTAAPITGGTITYQADSPFTAFDHPTGVSTYAYRTYFQNSVLAVNTTESDWLTSAGYSFYSLAKLRQRIKSKMWDSSFIVQDTDIDDWINEYREQMINEVIKINEDYALGTENVALASNGKGTLSASDFVSARRIWVTYNGVDKFQSTKMNVNDFNNDEQFSTVHPYHYWEGDSTLGVKPASVGTAELVFYRFGNILVNDTDELPLPMRPFTTGFVEYGLGNALFRDGKITESDRKMQAAEKIKQDFVNKVVPRDKTGPTQIDIVEPISGEDGYI